MLEQGTPRGTLKKWLAREKMALSNGKGEEERKQKERKQKVGNHITLRLDKQL
ncbi:hypothetical protein N6O34_22275 [Escherichia coli]|nr:hypothetical protein [Escherichia coli]MDC7030768.1 hypothetical protein [Escherichia coli]